MDHRLKPWLFINFPIFWSFGAEGSKMLVTHKKTKRQPPANSQDGRNKLIQFVSPKNVANTSAIDMSEVNCSIWRRKVFWGRQFFIFYVSHDDNVYFRDILEALHCLFPSEFLWFSREKRNFSNFMNQDCLCFLGSHSFIEKGLLNPVILRNSLLKSKLRPIKLKPGIRLNARS